MLHGRIRRLVVVSGTRSDEAAIPRSSIANPSIIAQSSSIRTRRGILVEYQKGAFHRVNIFLGISRHHALVCMHIARSFGIGLPVVSLGARYHCERWLSLAVFRNRHCARRLYSHCRQRVAPGIGCTAHAHAGRRFQCAGTAAAGAVTERHDGLLISGVYVCACACLLPCVCGSASIEMW